MLVRGLIENWKAQLPRRVGQKIFKTNAKPGPEDNPEAVFLRSEGFGAQVEEFCWQAGVPQSFLRDGSRLRGGALARAERDLGEQDAMDV